jgi:hypothetical protein
MGTVLSQPVFCILAGRHHPSAHHVQAHCEIPLTVRGGGAPGQTERAGFRMAAMVCMGRSWCHIHLCSDNSPGGSHMHVKQTHCEANMILYTKEL